MAVGFCLGLALIIREVSRVCARFEEVRAPTHDEETVVNGYPNGTGRAVVRAVYIPTLRKGAKDGAPGLFGMGEVSLGGTINSYSVALRYTMVG
jgi:hypothetical protein